MKSNTDLNQSKKLAKFLPPESADFVWLIGHLHTDGPRYEVIREKYEVSEPENYWPCWSLAALLEVIRNNGRYELQMYEGGYYFEANGFMTESYFNPIDACIEMILKLHEQKLL